MREVSDEEVQRLINKFLAEIKSKHPRMFFGSKNMDWFWNDFRELLLRFPPSDIEEIIEFAFNHKENSIPPLTGSRDFFFRWNEFVAWHDRLEKIKKERQEIVERSTRSISETKEYIQELEKTAPIPMPIELKAHLKKTGLI